MEYWAQLSALRHAAGMGGNIQDLKTLMRFQHADCNSSTRPREYQGIPLVVTETLIFAERRQSENV